MRADTRLMKQLNINTLRRVLSEQGQATKPQLAGLTGLSVVTVNALIAEKCGKWGWSLPAAAALPCYMAITMAVVPWQLYTVISWKAEIIFIRL